MIKTLDTPAIFSKAVGGTMNSDDLRNAFGGKTYASLQCDSTEYVSGVFTCWGSDANHIPTVQIACPADVQKEDTCTASVVKVVSF